MFSFKAINKKQKQLQRLLSVFVERIFYSCEDIICKKRLSYPCSIKGYLYYKTITSQNVLSEAQVKNFFIS